MQDGYITTDWPEQKHHGDSVKLKEWSEWRFSRIIRLDTVLTLEMWSQLFGANKHIICGNNKAKNWLHVQSEHTLTHSDLCMYVPHSNLKQSHAYTHTHTFSWVFSRINNAETIFGDFHRIFFFFFLFPQNYLGHAYTCTWSTLFIPQMDKKLRLGVIQCLHA